MNGLRIKSVSFPERGRVSDVSLRRWPVHNRHTTGPKEVYEGVSSFCFVSFTVFA